MPTERKCKLCKQPGHNRRTCKFHTVSVATPKPSPAIESDTCPICMETLEKTNYASTKCGHQFCLECLLRHVGNKANCPICRAVVGNVPTPVLTSEASYEWDLQSRIMFAVADAQRNAPLLTPDILEVLHGAARGLEDPEWNGNDELQTLVLLAGIRDRHSWRPRPNPQYISIV